MLLNYVAPHIMDYEYGILYIKMKIKKKEKKNSSCWIWYENMLLKRCSSLIIIHQYIFFDLSGAGSRLSRAASSSLSCETLGVPGQPRE